MIARGRSFSGHERDCCFLNTADGGKFATASAAVGLDQPDDGRGVGLTDWDGDGDVDIWTSRRSAPRVRFMRNDLPQENDWLALRLEGRTCVRDAIGARVEVTIRDKSGPHLLIQTVRAGHSFVSQSSRELLFGLGKGTLESIVVHWPGQRATETFTGAKPRARWRLIQGQSKAVKLELPRQKPLAAGPPELPEADPATQVLLTQPLPLPQSGYVDLSGKVQPIKPGAKPLLLTLWATWCSPCLKEMKEFAAAADQLAVVDVLALNADGIGEGEGANPQKIRAALQACAWPEAFKAGVAPAGLVKTLTLLHHKAIYLERDPALPSSFLIDPSGRLAAVYHGPVKVERILRDAALCGKPYDELRRAAFPFPGLSVTTSMRTDIPALAQAYHDGSYSLEALAMLQDYLKTPGGLTSSSRASALWLTGQIESALGHHDAAIKATKLALKLEPETPGLPAALATILWKAGKNEEAKTAMLDASAPDTMEAWAGVAQTWLALSAWGQAISAADAALKLAPGTPGLLFLRFAAMEKLPGRAATAIAGYQALLNGPKPLPEAANNLAWILATHPDKSIRNPAAALKLANSLAASTARRDAGVLDTLAAAEAATGDFAAAQSTAAEALRLARATGNDFLSAELTKKLLNYRQKQPFLDPTYKSK